MGNVNVVPVQEEVEVPKDSLHFWVITRIHLMVFLQQLFKEYLFKNISLDEYPPSFFFYITKDEPEKEGWIRSFLFLC